jgi:predicted peptidase
MNVSPMPQVLAAAMDAFSSAYRVDTDRTYLTGFSYGASQVWLIGEQMPQRFAALVPYAGRATPDPAKTARALARMPVYIGSGEIDTFFSSQCDTMYKELLAAGDSDVVRRQIPAGNHFSYSVIYTDPQFLDWLLSKRISQRPATRPATTQPVQ